MRHRKIIGKTGRRNWEWAGGTSLSSLPHSSSPPLTPSHLPVKVLTSLLLLIAGVGNARDPQNAQGTRIVRYPCPSGAFTAILTTAFFGGARHTVTTPFTDCENVQDEIMVCPR